MTFPAIDERMLENLITEADARTAARLIDPRMGRLRALHATGRTFQLDVYIDAQPPRTFLFTSPPTLLDVASCLGDLPLEDHIVSLRMSTHTFAQSVPSFLDHARTPKIAQRVEPLILSEEQTVNMEANDAA